MTLLCELDEALFKIALVGGRGLEAEGAAGRADRHAPVHEAES